MGVVLASKGYPSKYQKGFPISIDPSGVRIYPMGTAAKDGQLVTAGGRVMMCVARANTLEEARLLSYAGVSAVHCDNLFHRTDIAHIAFDE